MADIHMRPFYEELEQLPREHLLEIIREQDIEIWENVRRIEYVFEKRLGHLNWSDGAPIHGRPLTNMELALLIDEPFHEDPELTEMGFTVEEQKEYHIAQDPVLWAKHILKAEPRAYQILMMRWPTNRLVLRAGRRLGKTYTLSCILLHYAYTHNHGRCIVVAPMKEQAGLIYKEILKLVEGSVIVENQVERSVTAPQYEINFKNGSMLKFFTSGLRTGSKSDIVRGQEAHIIVLDELDYMHDDDLEALYAMLQQTAKGQAPKRMIGASTPSGRQGTFFKWCSQTDSRFKEFWYPSYVNPFFTKENEEEFRTQYTSNGYRHEIEADWGDADESVYPKRYLDAASTEDWQYEIRPAKPGGFIVMGVDWDKYGAGVNICAIEVCGPSYPDPKWRDKSFMLFREEMVKDEYAYLKAVDRIIELNALMNPEHIYVDRGAGELQVEQLHKYGVEHPHSNLRKKLRGISFSETIEIRDPATKEKQKKRMKPFMVDNLRQFIEKDYFKFPKNDTELYSQLLAYIVARITPSGDPVFESSLETKADHAHDALILAAVAITQNYSDMLKLNLARQVKRISSEALLPMFELSNNPHVQEEELKVVKAKWGGLSRAPIFTKRPFTNNLGRAAHIKRKMF